MVDAVAEAVGEADVVDGEMAAVHLEDRVVVGRGHPVRQRRPTRVEVAGATELLGGVGVALPPGVFDQIVL